MTQFTKSLDQLRRDAKALKAAYEAEDPDARARVDGRPPRAEKPYKHADYLHVVAQENAFPSWPAMKEAFETLGQDKANKRQRLRIALHNGQVGMVQRLLDDVPDLAEGDLGLQCALYDFSAVKALVAADPGKVTDPTLAWSPMSNLCKSPAHRIWPDRIPDMLRIAELLLAHGADLNQRVPAHEDPKAPVLYYAIARSKNLTLARWMLENGAEPNDDESLYHATEYPGPEALELVLEFGGRAKGTNALPRAIDFDDPAKVKLLLEAGANPNEFIKSKPGEEPSFVIPALHQAARRMASPEVIDLLLEAGANPTLDWRGNTAYAFACVYGHGTLKAAIEAQGKAPTLSHDEALMTKAAFGEDTNGAFINPDHLTDEFRNIMCHLVQLPDSLDHMKRLVEIGIEYDRPDPVEQVTPTQIAGWEGIPEVLEWFLSLRPDLGHVNRYGGGLMSTIIHGSGNAPKTRERDHVACLRLVLEHGIALPRRAITLAGETEVADFLSDWATRHPGQVVEHGFG